MREWKAQMEVEMTAQMESKVEARVRDAMRVRGHKAEHRRREGRDQVEMKESFTAKRAEMESELEARVGDAKVEIESEVEAKLPGEARRRHAGCHEGGDGRGQGNAQP